MMKQRLENRVALVTGASSGIGEATALALAEQGAKVAIAARREDRLQALAERLRGTGAEPLVLVADLLDEHEAQRIVTATQAHFGRLDILVNNAGVMYLEPIVEADLGRWRRMLELNVLSLIASTQAALPGMIERRDGHIVNVASTAGRNANPNAAAYAATKFGVVGFSEALRREVYKDNIRVSVIEPGAVATELRDHIGHAGVQQATNTWAEGMRQLQAEDVAEVIAFCVSRPAHVNINEVLLRPTDQER
jgi:NADP-dependent 3-hydroxy acid dehydrogenase YdfG